MRGPLSGFILVLTAAVLFGSLGTFSKLFFDAGGEPYTLLFLRFAVAGPALGLIALLRHDPWPGRRVALWGAALGGFQLAVAYALFEGYARAPVGLVTLLFFAYPLLTTLGAALVFREPLRPRRLAIVGVAVAGIALTIGVPDSAVWVGIVLGLVAAVGVASLILSSRFLMTARSLSPIVLGFLMFTSPALALLVVWPAHAPELSLTATAWGWAAAAIAVSGFVPIALFYSGVARVEAGVAGLLSSAEPLVSVLLASAVLGEELTAGQLGGGALIVIAVVLLSLEGLGRGRAMRAGPGNG